MANERRIFGPAVDGSRGSGSADAVRGETAEVLEDRWPALLHAMRDYKRKVAEDFTALAYRCVSDGIIRLEDRRRLAKAAHRAGIRAFDAQLLIACAIRQRTLDDGRKAREERRSGSGGWARMPVKWRLLLLVSAAVGLDALVVWRWFW